MNRGPGSATFGTSIIKTDEYVLLAQTMVENGQTVESAAKDIEMLDDLLAMQQYTIINAQMRRTSTGKLRKNSSILDMYENRVNHRVEQDNQPTNE